MDSALVILMAFRRQYLSTHLLFSNLSESELQSKKKLLPQNISKETDIKREDIKENIAKLVLQNVSVYIVNILEF